MSQTRDQAQKVPGLQGDSDLGLHVVGHIVGCAAQWDLPDGPRGIVRQVGRQDADPQLALGVEGVSEARHPVKVTQVTPGPQGSLGPDPALCGTVSRQLGSARAREGQGSRGRRQRVAHPGHTRAAQIGEGPLPGPAPLTQSRVHQHHHPLSPRVTGEEREAQRR